MAHAEQNFKTKAELKKAIKEGKTVYVQPSMFGGFGGFGPKGEKVVIEGPWEYHKWYASATIDPSTGRVLKVS